MRNVKLLLTMGLLISANAGNAQLTVPNAEAMPILGSVSGAILDAVTGSPLPQLAVRIGSLTTNTDVLGRYTLHAVPPGRHSIIVGTLGKPASAYGVGTVVLEPKQDLRSIDFHIPVKGSFAGKIVDENREPSSHLEIVLIKREYFLGKIHNYRRLVTYTNDKGEYRIEGVLSGIPYLLLARYLDHNLNALSDAPSDPRIRPRVRIPTYYFNSPSPEGGERIVLRAGEQRDGNDIRMRSSASYCIEGSLVAAEQRGEMNFSIHEQEVSFGLGLSGGTTGIPSGGKVGADGKLRICGLHPGEYVLNGYSGSLNNFTSFGTTLVTIGNGDVRNLSIVLNPPLSLRGRVDWVGEAKEKPTAKMTILLTPVHRTYGGSASAANVPIPGEFAIESSVTGNLFEDDYFVRIQGLDSKLYLKDIIYGNTSVLHRPLLLKDDRAVELRILVGNDGAHIGAQVADQDGKPVHNANIVLMPDNAFSEADLGAMRIIGQTDQNGVYRSGALMPGKYYILASTSEVADLSPETVGMLWRARSRGKEVTVGPSATAQLIMEPITLD